MQGWNGSYGGRVDHKVVGGMGGSCRVGWVMHGLGGSGNIV